MLRCFEGRTRKNRRREISSLLRSLYSFASRHAFLPVFLRRCLRANARIRPRFTGHRAPVAGSNPRPVGQFPFGPFPFLAFAPSIRHAPTRIGNQFRETVINGRERSVVRYVIIPSLCRLALFATVSRFPCLPLFFIPVGRLNPP